MSCIGHIACQLGGLGEESPLPEDTGPRVFTGVSLTCLSEGVCDWCRPRLVKGSHRVDSFGRSQTVQAFLICPVYFHIPGMFHRAWCRAGTQ